MDTTTGDTGKYGLELERREIKVEAPLRSAFTDHFNRDPVLIAAPGRINLLGEHLDYNSGCVLPAAIDKTFIFAMAPNHSGKFHIVAKDLGETVNFSVEELSSGKGWCSYLMGVIQGIMNHGKKPGGVDCMFSSNIPAGAGLSSSAALCCGFGFALNEIFRLELSRFDLARVAQFSEHEFAGVKCGIMDQYASLFSKKDHLLLLDCLSLSHQVVPFRLEGFKIMLIDTKVKHDLAASAYNNRREACEQGLSILKKKNNSIKSFRDAGDDDLLAAKNLFEDDVFLKCQYVVEEMARVTQGVRLLNNSSYKAFGEVMYQAHAGLRDKYEVSCAELDFLVDMAANHHVAGSRMMGGGFGGCTINLIEESMIKDFVEAVESQYTATFGASPEFHTVQPGDGVRVIS